jgi:dTDP-4-dehydrorhamnose reductase
MDVTGLCRKSSSIFNQFAGHYGFSVRTEIEVDKLLRCDLERIISELKPDYVVNCVGIIKQYHEVDESSLQKVNSDFPMLLASVCSTQQVSLLHFSTDCVFSGELGGYLEEDIPSPNDAYGMSKLSGERIVSEGAMVFRTSLIGHSLFHSLSLIDWFLGQSSNEVKGYERAYFSGLPTYVLSKIVSRIIKDGIFESGLFHVGAHEGISKYKLLNLVNEVYSAGKSVIKEESFFCDRTLNVSRFEKLSGVQYPDWRELVLDMFLDYQKNEKFYQGAR